MTSAAVRVESLACPGVGSDAMRAGSRWSCRRIGCTGAIGRPRGRHLFGQASTLTSAERPQSAHEAVTARTPFWRMLASLMGGPGLLRMVLLELVLYFCDRDAFDLGVFDCVGR